ncbi:MAG: hypothetical protein ACRC51_08915 [Cetobacterium sp.]
MKDIIQEQLVLDYLSNTIHSEECSYRKTIISEFFSKPKNQTEIDFIHAIISYFGKVEKNINIGICPHCLGESYDLIIKK